MNIDQQIQFLIEDSEESKQIMVQGSKENDYLVASLNANIIVKNLVKVGLLQWRRKINPTPIFNELHEFMSESNKMLEAVDAVAAVEVPLDTFMSIYTDYLIGVPHRPVNLDALEGQPQIDGFFGNVLIGASDISEWFKYNKALPSDRRHDLAQRTNELYAGLLTRQISPQEGVKLGEKLWAERADDNFYASSISGFGSGNETVVDYQLGAILKKIGSTVPTVHAWGW